ncbi:MAG: hypothetical protein B6243_12455 [Anaerolineaceae bacterium 4572_5.2]|nr:MAG: hypothetical protein B6243_12455 [Anaerolineaceae bacterium 4572_5.2]
MDTPAILPAAQQLEREHYQAVLAEIRACLDAFPPDFQSDIRSFFDRLAQGEFSQVVVLLPYYLSDLLPLSAETLRKLSAAHLYGWWYYYVQDELLDGDAPPADLLGAHLALLKMLDIYTELGLPNAPCWKDFQRLSLNSAAAYAREMKTRFASLAELTPERLRLWNPGLIIDRAAPFYFNTIAQLYMAGVSPDQPLRGDLLAALKAFTAARQIGDDAGDWIDDLQRGQLNYVSAQLIGQFYKQDLTAKGEALDVERLAAWSLRNEEFWRELERITQDYLHKALDHLTSYGSCKLKEVIQRQMTQSARQWTSARQRRFDLRTVFGLG